MIDFSFLSLVPVSLDNFKCIFQNVSFNAAMAQTFLPCVRNWNMVVSRRDIEFCDPQVRQLRLRRETFKLNYSAHVGLKSIL